MIGSCLTAPPRFESFSLVGGSTCLGAVMAAPGAASARSSARRMVAAFASWSGQPSRWATDGRLLAKSCGELTALRTVFWRGRRGPSRRAERAPWHGSLIARGRQKSRKFGLRRFGARALPRHIYTVRAAPASASAAEKPKTVAPDAKRGSPRSIVLDRSQNALPLSFMKSPPRSERKKASPPPSSPGGHDMFSPGPSSTRKRRPSQDDALPPVDDATDEGDPLRRDVRVGPGRIGVIFEDVARGVGARVAVVTRGVPSSGNRRRRAGSLRV